MHAQVDGWHICWLPPLEDGTLALYFGLWCGGDCVLWTGPVGGPPPQDASGPPTTHASPIPVPADVPNAHPHCLRNLLPESNACWTSLRLEPHWDVCVCGNGHAPLPRLQSAGARARNAAASPPQRATDADPALVEALVAPLERALAPVFDARLALADGRAILERLCEAQPSLALALRPACAQIDAASRRLDDLPARLAPRPLSIHAPSANARPPTPRDAFLAEAARVAATYFGAAAGEAAVAAAPVEHANNGTGNGTGNGSADAVDAAIGAQALQLQPHKAVAAGGTVVALARAPSGGRGGRGPAAAAAPELAAVGCHAAHAPSAVQHAATLVRWGALTGLAVYGRNKGGGQGGKAAAAGAGAVKAAKPLAQVQRAQAGSAPQAHAAGSSKGAGAPAGRAQPPPQQHASKPATSHSARPPLHAAGSKPAAATWRGLAAGAGTADGDAQSPRAPAPAAKRPKLAAPPLKAGASGGAGSAATGSHIKRPAPLPDNARQRVMPSALRTLLAMGYARDDAERALRQSGGGDIETAIELLGDSDGAD
jgi:hypothetical protein